MSPPPRAFEEKTDNPRSSILEALSYDFTPDDCSRTALFAEFISMALFVWIGCGTAISTQAFVAFDPDTPLDNNMLLSIAMAFGWAIVVLAYSIAPISGGHINPAVTFALMLTGDVSLPTGLLYFLSQFLGAVFGAAILWGCTASQLLMEVSSTTGEENATSPPYLLGSNFVNPAVPLGSAFLLEVMGTFLLVWTVLNTAVSKHSIAANLAPMAIGFSVFLAHIVLIPFTGCGINPARTFGPHMVILMAGETVGKAGWWIYYTAPFVGAGAAALVCKYLLHLKPVVPSVEDKEGEFMEHKKTKAAKHTSYKGENSNSVVEANNTMDHSSAEFKI